MPEGGFWFDFVTLISQHVPQVGLKLPPPAEGAANPGLESSPGFGEETTEQQSTEDSTATQSYLSTGDFFFF